MKTRIYATLAVKGLRHVYVLVVMSSIIDQHHVQYWRLMFKMLSVTLFDT